MRGLKLFFITWWQWLCGSRDGSREIARKLSPEALEKALAEGKFLAHRQVDVRSLAAGEIPGLPKRADEE